MSANLENPAVAAGLEKVSFTSTPKKGNAKECSNYHTIVITYQDPDILECEVRWALGSITSNKANGGDGIPTELSQILKTMLLKCCVQHAIKFGKLSSGHRTGKSQFSFHLQRQCQRMLKLPHKCTHLTR